MNWQQVVADPNLKDLPYKIELNEWGQIVMTPARLMHGRYQAMITALLRQFMQQVGEVVAECAIQTSQGTKVADVAWFSLARWQQVQDELEASIAPEICVEIISPGNSIGEMKQKRKIYFEAGAAEVWICDASGKVRFYSVAGEISKSALVPTFPRSVIASA
jgi:Uma2 family endonuclease